MKKFIAVLQLLLVVMLAHAQMMNPVKFSTSLKTNGTAVAEIVFNGKIQPGWHVYSTGLGADGPISATFNVNKLDGVELVGKLQARGHEISKFDPLFEMKLRFFEGSATFVQKVKFTKPNYRIDAYLEYGACSDQNCLPPSEASFKKSGKSPAVDGKAETDSKEATKANGPEVIDVVKANTDSSSLQGVAEKMDSTANIDAAFSVDSDDAKAWWAPVVIELQAFGGNNDIASHSLFYIFIIGFVGGLLALVMPCIWPIIPMTVSFFLKRSKDKKKGIRDAWTYGASIVVIYVALGLAITLIFGASALNALSTNAVFNILFCLMLIVFAASFFGAFELTLPSKWSNAVDSKAEATSGLLSIFLMAFTLSLVSFSCTGPIIGFLLVQVSTTGSVVAPAIGMLGFAIALALPFTLFALFFVLRDRRPRMARAAFVFAFTLGTVFSLGRMMQGAHFFSHNVWTAVFCWLISLGSYYCILYRPGMKAQREANAEPVGA